MRKIITILLLSLLSFSSAAYAGKSPEPKGKIFQTRIEGTLTEIPVPDERSEWLLNDGENVYDLEFEWSVAPLWFETGKEIVAIGTLKKNTLTVHAFIGGNKVVEIPDEPIATDERSALVVLVRLLPEDQYGNHNYISYKAIFGRWFWQSRRGEAGTDGGYSINYFFQQATNGEIGFAEHLGGGAIVEMRPIVCNDVFDYVNAVEPLVNKQNIFYENYQHVMIVLPLRRYTGCPFFQAFTEGDGTGTEFIVTGSYFLSTRLYAVGKNMGLTGQLEAVINDRLVVIDFDQ